MAVQPQTPYKEYTANGSTKSFALEFDCDNQDHLIVLVDDIEPVVGTWSLSGGAVVFGTAPTTGKQIAIQRNTPFRRDEDFQSYDNSFRPPGVNKGFDKIWLKLQELGVGDWILSNRIDALKNYVDDRDDELRAYLMEEIRKQGVALDQLDEYYNYLMQRLAQIAVDKGWDASFVTYQGITQEHINDGVESIAKLRIINPKRKGIRLYLNSVIAGKDMGGGMFVSTQKAGLADNGGTIISSPNPALFWVRVNYDNVIPQFWGALGDKDNDDRPPFQSAVNYLHSIGGGELVVPKPIVEYLWKSYDVVESACLVIPEPLGGMYSNPITVRGAGNIIEIRAALGLGVLIDAAIKLKGSGLYKKFENLSVWGGLSHIDKSCKRVLDGWEGWHPNLTIRDCRFYSATEDCVRLATYVSVLDKVQTAYSPIGTKLEAPNAADAPITSITMNSCYGLNHTRHALWVGQLAYSTINSHAADHIINDANDGYEAYPYYIDIARGVTINGLGAESSTRILKVRSAQGLTINGIMTLFIGDNANPPAHLIRIDGGSSTVIGGIFLQNSKAYGKKLSLGGDFSTESVTVLDDTITPEEVDYSKNFLFDRPIRFLLRDYSRKTQIITLSNTSNAATNSLNLSNAVKVAYDTELLHDVIINFPSGTFEISDLTYLASEVSRGGGQVRLVGHADGTSKVLTTGNGGIYFGHPSNRARMSFSVERLELQIGAISGNNKAFFFDGSVTNFIGGKLTSDNLARQCYSTNEAVIKLDADSAIMTPVFGDPDALVEFTYKATSAPTGSTKLPAGTTFKASDPNATRIGWINTTNNGATWLALTP